MNYKQLIGNDSYIVYRDNEIIESFDNKQENLKVFYHITKDTKIENHYHENKNITEVFYLGASCTIDITCSEFTNIEDTRIIASTADDVTLKVNTHLQKGAYINNRSIIALNGKGEVKEVINLSEDANYQNTNVILNGNTVTQSYHVDVNLNENNAQSNMTCYCLCKNDGTLNIYTNGIIKKGAHQTNVAQKTRGLLLSEYSTIAANPQLIIDDFDCLASHGASIGAIDEDELYYLMSRGLTKEESERLIIGGFITPVLNEITDEKIKDYIQTEIKKIL